MVCYLYMVIKMQTYLILKDSTVINSVIADSEFANSQNWILKPDNINVDVGWSYIDGQFIAPTVPSQTLEQIKANNKEQAELLLQQTDWTQYPDVADKTRTPHLVNLNEWIDYRVALRATAVNPPETEVTEWPVKPQEVWSSQ